MGGWVHWKQPRQIQFQFPTLLFPLTPFLLLITHVPSHPSIYLISPASCSLWFQLTFHFQDHVTSQYSPTLSFPSSYYICPFYVTLFWPCLLTVWVVLLWTYYFYVYFFFYFSHLFFFQNVILRSDFPISLSIPHNVPSLPLFSSVFGISWNPNPNKSVSSPLPFTCCWLAFSWRFCLN